jgi:anti-anti-sigma factor
VNYSIEKVQDVVVIELSGDSWGGLDAFQLKDEVKAILAMGHRRFLVDFSDAHFVNSAGIGILVSCWVSVRNVQGEVLFCEPGRRVQRALDVSGVMKLFDVHETRSQALQSYGIDPDSGS